MYTFSDNVRIRECGDLSFFINIKDNTIISIKTKTLHFLKIKIKEGLSQEKLYEINSDVLIFIKNLEKQGILGVIENET